tara:strand:- start:706 stop:1332 length:627 start_codon:yes stop_codon:yes gene_type:complete
MEILLATKNNNKFIELKKIFDQSNSQHELLFYPDLIEVVEDKETIFENAKKKAIEVYKEYQKPIIADDSGLFVKSLNGQPGVKSARYAGDQANDEDNIEKLLYELENEENRVAYFKTILFFYDGEKEITTEGILEGEITFEPRGDNGFGYDPVFETDPPVYGRPVTTEQALKEMMPKTLAELSLDQKTKISHRKNACIKMVELLNEKI